MYVIKIPFTRWLKPLENSLNHYVTRIVPLVMYTGYVQYRTTHNNNTMYRVRETRRTHTVPKTKTIFDFIIIIPYFYFLSVFFFSLSLPFSFPAGSKPRYIYIYIHMYSPIMQRLNQILLLTNRIRSSPRPLAPAREP